MGVPPSVRSERRTEPRERQQPQRSGEPDARERGLGRAPAMTLLRRRLQRSRRYEQGPLYASSPSSKTSQPYRDEASRSGSAPAGAVGVADERAYKIGVQYASRPIPCPLHHARNDPRNARLEFQRAAAQRIVGSNNPEILRQDESTWVGAQKKTRGKPGRSLRVT